VDLVKIPVPIVKELQQTVLNVKIINIYKTKLVFFAQVLDARLVQTSTQAADHVLAHTLFLMEFA
jgi:hypothetical protein